MAVHVSIVGQRFGRLVALERVTTASRVTYRFECDCGKRKNLLLSNVKRGRTRSCGCLCVETSRVLVSRISSPKPTLRGFLSSVKSTYITSAKRRGLTWALTDQQLTRLFKSACHYCGRPPHRRLHTTMRSYSASDSFVYTGIDRKDPTRGYVLNNVVPACSTCNIAKRRMTYREFLAWIRRVAKHLIR